LILKHDEPLSNVAFSFNLRPFNQVGSDESQPVSDQPHAVTGQPQGGTSARVGLAGLTRLAADVGATPGERW